MEKPITLDQCLMIPDFFVAINMYGNTYSASLFYHQYTVVTREGGCSSRAYDKLSLAIVLEKESIWERVKEIELLKDQETL